jgi:hypothetical protein
MILVAAFSSDPALPSLQRGREVNVSRSLQRGREVNVSHRVHTVHGLLVVSSIVSFSRRSHTCKIA